MAMRKRAVAVLTEVKMLEETDTNGVVKTAAARKLVDANQQAKQVVDAEMKKHSTALFFRAKAIVADETNSNGDFFSEEELIKSAHTFVGVPFYTNHENTDITKAKGKIVFSEWDPKDKAIYVIGFIDREAYPQLCRGVEQEYMTGVSMGAIDGDSLIAMADGTEKPMRDVKSGEMVMSPFGRKCKVRLTHKAILGKPMFKFDLEAYHKTPLFTEDHPVMIISAKELAEKKNKWLVASNRGGRSSIHPYTVSQGGWRTDSFNTNFVEAEDVNVGDYIVVPSRFKLFDDGKNSIDDFYYVAGAYLGNGYAANAKNGKLERLTFCLGLQENEINQKISDSIEKVSDKKANWVPEEERNGLYLSIYDRSLGEKMVKMFGNGSRNKRISNKEITVSQAKSLLCGYLDTDGCIVKRTKDGMFGGFQIGSNNIGLLEDAQSLLIALGIPSRISTVNRTPSPNSIVKVPTIEHTLAIGSNGLRAFEWSHKVQKANPTPSRFSGGKTFVFDVGDTKAMACRILKKETVPFENEVYDLTVEEDESYIANGMGVHNCVVEYSECSICRNKAATVEDYCSHIKFRKGRTFSGTSKDVKTGEVRTFKNAPIFEKNYGVRFIELSGVGDPACKSCHIEGVFDNEQFAKAASFVGSGNGFLSKVASVQNSLMMYQETSLYKEASKQELEQIDQVLSTLEKISIGLIKNRKRVEVEFASDLVKILSELQEFADELTGAGYGQLEGAPEGEETIPGLDAGAGAPEAAIPGLDNTPPPPAEGVPNASGAAGLPVSDISSTNAPVGQISGSPSKPVVSTPKMPTAPKKPMAASQDRLQRVAELVTAIRTALAESTTESDEGEDSMKRRTPTTASNERASIKQALSNGTKETDHDLENGIGYGDSIKQSGGSKMSEIKVASRTDAPGVTTEKQLDATLKNHPRTGAEANSTTEDQLVSKRKDAEPQTLNEDQLKAVRKDNEPGVTTEKQLAALRKENEPNETTQAQLESERVGNEPEVLTEKQIEGKATDLYARASMNRQTIKTAEQHAKSVIEVLAKSAIQCSATPQQIREATMALVDGTKARSSTLDAVTSELNEVEKKTASTADIVSKVRYWGSKGVTLASSTREDISQSIVSGLKVLIARDAKISPEAVMDVLDVVSAEDSSVNAISDGVEDLIAEPEAVAAYASSSMKKQIKAAVLSQSNVEHLDEPPAPVKERAVGAVERAKEREGMKAALASKKPSHVIVTSAEEIGITLDEIKKDQKTAKAKIVAFVKKVTAMQDLTVEQKQEKDGKQVLVASKVKQLKVANITNVTVDKDGTIQIAIQSDEGTSADVSIPLDDQGNGVENAPVEGDATGEGLDNLLGGDTAGAAPAMPPAAPAPEAPLPTAAAKGKMEKTAQFGGAGGGAGGDTLGGGKDQGAALPQGMPAMDKGEGLQSFTDDEKEEEKAPGVGEQMMPGSICPFCHSNDTTTGKKELPAGAFECNNCGSVYEVHVNIEVLNPEGMSFEKGEGTDNVVEPKLPDMPVAASVKLDKAGLEKIASCETKVGHVCPACGMTECKPQEKTAGSIVYVCPACETKTTKEILVASDKSSYMNIQWNLNPKKVFSAGCKTCKQAALEYAALVKVTTMMKKAAEGSKKPETAFPMANCAEYVSRRWGANATATFGPCRGQPLADCACKQLEAFGLRKRMDIEKLASVYAQPDPMDECLKMQMGKGYKQAQADTICKSYQKKYAKESDNNEWLEAFGGDSRFTTEELRIMKQKSDAILNKKAQVAPVAPVENLEADLSMPLDDVQPVGDEAQGEETVMVEIPESLAKDLAGQISEQTEAPAEAAPVDLESVGEPVVAGSKAAVKVAAKQTKVEDISSGVEGKVKGGKGTLGNESKSNIDVPAIKPNVPSNESASKIKGEKQTIPEATLPDIATGDALIAGEKETQKGMPANNIDARGRVIAKQQDGLSKEAAKPTKVEDISSGVAGKVKGGNGAIGNEGKDNIDVPADKPNIPSRGKGSEIEGEKQTIPDATLPDIATGDAFIGGEKEAQKGMPANNIDIRGRVLESDAKREKQTERIAAARNKKASQVAGKLMGMGRISESDYDAVVEDLSKIEVDRIEAFADRMYRNVKTSATAPAVLSTPIVQEASAYKPELPKTANEELKGIFTIGSPLLNEKAMEDDRNNA